MSKNLGGGASVSTDVASGTSAATDVSLREHLAELRTADAKFAEERDRRYAEVAIEREKALKIKESADLAALGLARDIQIYKDEKANELRSQIERERGTYASKDDLAAAVSKIEVTLKPMSEYIATQAGRSQGVGSSFTALATGVAVFSTIFFIIAYLLATHT